MTRSELLEQVEDLTSLLAAIDRLVPGRVEQELLTFLDGLRDCPVTADLLLASLKLDKERDQKADGPRRRVV